MAISTSQPSPLHVNGMRKPDIGGLPGVDQPRRSGLRFQINVNEFRFSGRTPELVGVASGAGVVLREAGERTVAVEGVTCFAFRIAGFFGVRLVQEIDRLRSMRIKDLGEDDPTSNQGKSKTKGEDEKSPFHM